MKIFTINYLPRITKRLETFARDTLDTAFSLSNLIILLDSSMEVYCKTI